MRAVIQRVSAASVSVDDEIVGKIKIGLLILLGIEDADTIDDGLWLAAKIANTRIFNDDNGVMNRSVNDIHGEALVISQFTLFASTRKGNRPSYLNAGKPEFASKMYEIFCQQLSREMSRPVKEGIFGADMKVSLINDGPVTLLIDTKIRE
jgi:D-tyrosyl-tRNA(Tyr) deacylase